MVIFKIATFNVNSLRARLPVVIPWLQKNRPDVLCLQETKVADDQFPREEIESAGYHVVYRGSKQYNGVAVASLKVPDKVTHGLGDDGPADEDRLICCVFSDIVVLNTYVPQGRTKESPEFAYKLKWFRRLRAFLERSGSPAGRLVWCGDLNVAPEKVDVHDPKRLLGHVCFNPEVWEAFAAVKEWGLIDVFRKHHPDEPGQYTFFDYRVAGSVERGRGWRVDHILSTATLAERSLTCRIDMQPRLEAKPSDHTPVMAEFDLS